MMAEFCRRSLLTLIILVLALTAPAVVAEGVAEDKTIIQLKREILVLTRTYSLRDIADVRSTDSALLARLLAVEVGRTPLPGQITRITRHEIWARLQRQQPDIAQQLEWRGAASVQVEGGGVAYDGAALEQSAYRFLSDWLEQRYNSQSGSASMQDSGHYRSAMRQLPATIAINRIGKPDVLVVPLGEISYHPHIANSQMVRKRMSVWVDIKVDNQPFQTIPVWFAVTVHMRVPVITNTVEKHQVLARENIATELHDIAGLSGTPIVDNNLIGHRTRRRLTKGSVITGQDVELMPLVNEGEWITVFANHGPVSLAIKGRAMTEGNLSQSIMVNNPSSGESYRAWVVGKGQARVD